MESHFNEAKNLTAKELEALRYLRNQMVHGGKSPSTRELMKALGYKSPRSATVLLQKLEEFEIISRNGGEIHLQDSVGLAKDRANTVLVPLIGQVAAGSPILAEENLEAMISVDERLIHGGSPYYLLRVKGDSMDKADINDGDLVLVRSQRTANSGEKVVALIDNEATVKEMKITSSSVILVPHSSNPANKPIVLTSDFQIQGVVVDTIKNPDI